MHRVFFDANILIDWLNKNSIHQKICSDCIEKSIQTSATLLVSPTTLAIVYYFVSKQIKNRKQVKITLEDCFKLFEFTTEDAFIVKQSFISKFTDLEDALQYFSAIESKADTIVTFNILDFAENKIPALHPNYYLSFFE